MDSEQVKPVKLPPPYQPINYFLSSLNTFFGKHLVQRLRNENVHPENPNKIVGTTSKAEPNIDTPPGVRKVIDTQKVTFFQDVLLNSDVIIYDLNTCDPKQIEFVISTLKIKQFSELKTLICISNVMTWAASSPKQKKEGQQEEGDDNPPEQPDTEQQGEANNEGQQKKTYVRFTDKDYSLRKPLPQYQKIKSLQTLCLAAGNAKPNLRTYVVCSGILYGQGQRIFEPYYLQARLQKPPALQYFGKGKNRIPCVHIQDLITYIQKIIEKKPAIPYILAIDQNPKPTLKKIMESISKGIGTGQIVSAEAKPQIPNIDILTINIRMKPTMYFAKIQQEQAAQQQQEGNEIPKFKFNWQCKQGIQKNIQKLRCQYNKAKGFYQEKVFITGPPGSGKTFFAAQMAQKYYLPHIHIKGVIEQVKALKNQFSQEIINFLNQKKQAEISQKQAQYDQLKQKIKKIPKQLRDPIQPFDPQKVQPRLSDQLVYKCYKWRLTQNDCLNRGYILDAYPRKYEDAAQVFMWIPPVQQGEQGGQQNQKKVIDERIIPKKLIILNMSDEQIVARLRSLPEQKIFGTHFTQEQNRRRLKIYRENMDQTTGNLILEDFFKQNNISLFKINISSQTSLQLESIIKPQGISQQDEVNIVKQRIRREEQERKKKREQMDKKQTIIREIQKTDYTIKKENQNNQQREILERKSLSLRKYLDTNVVPFLSDGIVEILKENPKDPVDTLAKFLFENSLKVPFPDPSTFDY